MRNVLDNGEKPRKKYRVSNVFVDTYLQCRFPLVFASREATVNHAVRTMTFFSNFKRVIRTLYSWKPPAEVPKAPGQTVMDVFG